MGFLGLAASVAIAQYGHPTAAASVGVTTVIALVSVFVLGRRHLKEAEKSAPTKKARRPQPPTPTS
jgi:uncharacterized membrane protein (DUF4010 family)